MSVDPASWQPGKLIVNRDDMLAAQLDERDGDGWHVLVADMEIAIPQFIFDADLAESWRPLADVVARGWEQRQEVPYRHCLTHGWPAQSDLCTYAVTLMSGTAQMLERNAPVERCRLVPLSYPITEGNNE